MLAHKLCDIGVQVALVEKYPTLASGPSTRNEGWLHRGTYHAASIKNRHAAIQIAKRCIYGHEQLRRFCPEAIEDKDAKPLAIIGRYDQIDEITSRWREADVQFRPITHGEANKIISTASFDKAAAVFEANDVSLNTRLLYRKLFSLAKKAGCYFYIGYEIEHIDGLEAILRSSTGEKQSVRTKKFVYSSGTGAKDIFNRLHNVDLPIRYWKSHLVITRRLAPVGVFYVDAHEAAMMHHEDVSIVGLNEDALLCTGPSYEVMPDRSQNLHKAITRLFPNWNSSDRLDIACTKVDLVSNLKEARSLNIAVQEPVPGHVCVLPGKMTEAPYLTDVLVSVLHRELDATAISLRPCDSFSESKTRQG